MLTIVRCVPLSSRRLAGLVGCPALGSAQEQFPRKGADTLFSRASRSVSGRFRRSVSGDDRYSREGLAVAGRWTQHHLESYELYIDAREHAEAPQLVVCLAPPDDYRRYLEAAAAAMASIRWKTPRPDDR